VTGFYTPAGGCYCVVCCLPNKWTQHNNTRSYTVHGSSDDDSGDDGDDDDSGDDGDDADSVDDDSGDEDEDDDSRPAYCNSVKYKYDNQ
jgi:hypothetical protein